MPRLLIVDGHGSHTNTDFMWECYQRNIYTIFLPAHTSHITQPLDVSVFGPLKKHYRNEVSYRSSLVDGSDLGKQGFLRCYALAHHRAFSNVNIRSGWKTTGLWPVNRNKVLESSQFTINTGPPLLPDPVTPRRFTRGGIEYPGTPQRSQDMKKFINMLDGTPRTIKRHAIYALEKSGKAIDKRNVNIVGAERRTSEAEAKLELCMPYKKKRVVPNPNVTFVNIANIKRSQRLAEKIQWKSLAAIRDQEKEFDSLCDSFRLEEVVMVEN